jgi:hypothetical protein
MSQRSEIDRVLAELGGACGLPGLALNEDGVVALTIGEVPVSLSYIASPAELLMVMVEITTMAEDDQATPSRVAIRHRGAAAGRRRGPWGNPSRR